MPEDIEALSALQRDPEVNRAVMAMLVGECMEPPEYTALMKVLTVIWRETDERS